MGKSTYSFALLSLSCLIFPSLLFLTNLWSVDGKNIIFDEPRYTSIALPFLYFMSIKGLLALGKVTIRNDIILRKIIIFLCLALATFSYIYSLYQARIPFPVPDLSVGKTGYKKTFQKKQYSWLPELEKEILIFTAENVGLSI